MSLTCLPPPTSSFKNNKRWFQELNLQILYAEDISIKDHHHEPSKPQLIYVKSRIRGQKLRITQKTEARPLVKDENGTVVTWYAPTTYKICIQSLFQNPTVEFLVMHDMDSKLLVDQVIGVVSVPIKVLHDPTVSPLLRFPIVSKVGKECKGFLCLTKEMKQYNIGKALRLV